MTTQRNLRGLRSDFMLTLSEIDAGYERIQAYLKTTISVLIRSSLFKHLWLPVLPTLFRCPNPIERYQFSTGSMPGSRFAHCPLQGRGGSCREG